MLVDAVRPLLIRLPERDVRLVPGTPIDLAPRYARRLLQAGKVRLVVLSVADWLTLWEHVARLSNGLTAEDPRLPMVRAALARCDWAFELGDKQAFLHAVEEMGQAMGPLVPGDEA